MSSPPGPKISLRIPSSNFPAAATSASAACCGVSKVLAPTATEAGADFVIGCCAVTWRDINKNANVTASQGNLARLALADFDFIICPHDLLARPRPAYLRPPPPRPPPPRDPML